MSLIIKNWLIIVKFYHRVLDLAKTAPQEAVTDEVSLLLAIKVHRKDLGKSFTHQFTQVYLTHGVPELLAAPDTR